MPIDLTLMVAGGLCMGSALANTGAGDLIGNAIANTASSLGNPYLIGALFYLIPFFLTQIMQNRTVMAIFAPIAILACKSMDADCTGPLLVVFVTEEGVHLNSPNPGHESKLLKNHPRPNNPITRIFRRTVVFVRLFFALSVL